MLYGSSITIYYFGTIINVYLYGTLTVQLYRYYMSFPKDRKAFKIVIYIVYVVETMFTIFIIYTEGTFVNGLQPIAPAFVILVVCRGTVELLTQSMYGYRIRIITKLKYIPWVIVLVITSKLFAMTIAYVVMELNILFITTVWASLSLVVDVTITSIMVWFLKKDQIYSKRLKRKIEQLIYAIICTGFLTAATNLCLLVVISPFFKHSIGLLMVLPNLYANSMMVLVNNRIPSVRSDTNNRATLDMITVQLSSFRVTSRAATDAERGQREALVFNPESRVGSSAHGVEDADNNHDAV